MEFRTIVEIPKPDFEIQPCEEVLLVGSCFAGEIGQHFRDEGFPTVVNPFGTMYNPVSILHTLQRYEGNIPRVVFLTLGTNHVYRLKETNEIVDNCEKRPAALFQEEELSITQCVDCLQQTVDLLQQKNPDVHVIFTVSPIRYRKYGYHESLLSKATLLLAVDKLLHQTSSLLPRLRTADGRIARLPFLCFRHAASVATGGRLCLGTAGGDLFLAGCQDVSRRVASAEANPGTSSF